MTTDDQNIERVIRRRAAERIAGSAPQWRAMAAGAADDGNDAEAEGYRAAAGDIEATGTLTDSSLARLLRGLVDTPAISPETRQGLNDCIGRLDQQQDR